MTQAPNPSEFSVNEKLGEYIVVISISGEMRINIKAESQEEADAKAEEIADQLADDQMEAELDTVDDIEIQSVHRPLPMFRVTRDGKKMQVSRLMAGDLPRDPDERGF